MRKKNYFKSLMWKFLKALPRPMRRSLTTRFFMYKPQNGEDFTYKVAETIDEIAAALEIVQESYLKSGLCKDEAKIRASKYNLLPSTVVFIAIDNKTQEIIATISSIHKTSLGLPIEEMCDISNLDIGRERCCELSGLSIKESFRSKSSNLFVVLTLYAVKYSNEVVGTDHFFISVRESVRVFYEDLFAFDQIGKARSYSGVNNVIGAPMYFNLPLALVKLKEWNLSKQLNQNIFRLYTEFPWKDSCELARGRYNFTARFYLDSDKFNFLKAQQVEFLKAMNVEDIINLNNIYISESILKIQTTNSIDTPTRRFYRFSVNQKGVFKSSLNEFQVMEVSMNGLMLKFSHYSRVPRLIECSIEIEKNIFVDLTIEKKWSFARTHGFEIVSEVPAKWIEMITCFHKQSNIEIVYADEASKVA